ncbi:ArsR family transcriptional regulator [Bacillus sp. UMB0728]|nr:ArsR family transcriptional regulator [Bacillus sp. UMB0728]
MEKKDKMPHQISVEQSKLLGNALRIKIISVLQEKPLTSKQVSELLGNSPGSVHYHIQKLNEGGLIELVETKVSGGIIEKYYKAKSKWYQAKGGIELDSALSAENDQGYSTNLSLRLFLKEEDRDRFLEDVKNLLEKWVKNSDLSNVDEMQEYAVGLRLVEALKKEDH